MVYKELISSAQGFTTSWVDLGEEFTLDKEVKYGLWLKLDVGTTVNPRFRIVAKLSKGDTDEYELVTVSPALTGNLVEGAFYEFNTDEDQNILIDFAGNGVYSVAKVQIQAGTAGNGQITSAILTGSSY